MRKQNDPGIVLYNHMIFNIMKNIPCQRSKRDRKSLKKRDKNLFLGFKLKYII